MFLNKRKVILVISISTLVFFFTYIDVKSQNIRVVDGDTINLDGEKIRFSGIDSPELKQTCFKDGIKNQCGIAAKQLLINKIGNYNVKCVFEGRDRYKRILGTCFGEIDGKINDLWELNKMMIYSGYAVAYRKYSKKYIETEESAKREGAGLGKYSHYIHPEEWRRKNK